MKTPFWTMLAFGILCSCQEKTEEKGTPVIAVKTETVVLTTDYATNNYVGQVEENSCTSVSFSTAGTIKRIHVEEGQWVRCGQLIAEMDEASLHNNLLSAEATLKQAKDAYNRMQQLYEEQSLPEMKWVEAQSKMQQAQAVYDIAKEKWEDCRLTAPGDGIIGRKSANAGETVAPRQPVVTLLDVHQIKVRVSVPEKEINDIRSESVCYIDVPAAGLTGLQGERIVKNVKSDLLTHTYDIQIHLSNPDNRILPGMIGEVRFPQEVSKNISLPVTAVQQVAGGKHFVWTVSDGKACQKAVQVGKTHGARIVITEGLQAGEVVVTAGYQKLSTGTNVNVR